MQTKVEFPRELLLGPVLIMGFLISTPLYTEFFFHPHGGLILTFSAWMVALVGLLIGFFRGGRMLRENMELNTRGNRVALLLGGLALIGNLCLFIAMGIALSRPES